MTEQVRFFIVEVSRKLTETILLYLASQANDYFKPIMTAVAIFNYFLKDKVHFWGW